MTDLQRKKVAIVVLGQNSVSLARQLMQVLPGSQLYGLSTRTTEVDVSFSDFGETLRELFAEGKAIIGVCAAGILIRTLAPLLSDKRAEPPVLAIAEDGSAVVPLLGGLNGANDLARQVAAALGISPAITTTGDLRFRAALLSPPTGYRLANSDDQTKTFLADLLAGESVKIEGSAPWLSLDRLPISDGAARTIQVTERSIPPTPDRLVYHPATIAIALSLLEADPQEIVLSIQQQLAAEDLALASIAGVFAEVAEANHPAVQAIAQAFNVPARFFTPTHLAAALAQHQNSHQNSKYNSAAAIALTAVGAAGTLLACDRHSAIAVAPQPLNPDAIGQPQGKLTIIGTGPGGEQWMSPEVKAILESATDLVGYSTYLNLIGDLGKGRRHESDNREELARARMALDLATEGRSVVIVSSGDPGIYAMASAVFEVIDREANPNWNSIALHVAPGISAMQAAAAAIGAPLGHDFCAISLSDILKPWSIIAQRIEAAAAADFAIAFYNPVSKQRTWQLAEAQQILLRWRSPQTPVILARNLGRPGQSVQVIFLDQLTPAHADMRTVILIGSSQTRIVDRSSGGTWVYTPRNYESVVKIL
ncbi:MAG: precorrin-3B C(17)-methyltransferase [Drouetiella hepatica Uher 2000/2452]|uniref:Precorrin-3B C(17)-methyltransferase n=1 Tax=Drouetiella hepatica Uher 2000/2452 TaxID=904376 RepID=A0A951UME9_9CYAN|nr:precorrin-3B C(17)-methyltransferase [Drouetiella hepatica Uher 2000/2452]